MQKSSMRGGRGRVRVNLPASRFNHYNMSVVQSPFSSLRSDFAYVLAQKLGAGRVLVAGIAPGNLEERCAEAGIALTVTAGVHQLKERRAGNGSLPRFDRAIWFCPSMEKPDDRDINLLAQQSDELVLLAGPGVEFLKIRPILVDRFNQHGFVPDYDCDLGELGPGAIRLVRHETDGSPPLVPAAESAFLRLHLRTRTLERTLDRRTSELEAADRHIAKLEEKILKLREASSELKQLKKDKQALRKCPERKVGQVILAPYRLPQKLLRQVRRQWRQPNESKPQENTANEYQIWLETHRVSAARLASMREEARHFVHQPLISIVTPIFNPTVAGLKEAVESVLAQAYENWELVLIDDASTDPDTLAALPRLAQCDARIRFGQRKENGGISVASNDGLALAKGDWVGFLDHDDLLEPDALFEVVRLLQSYPDADLIYSDEDRLTENGFEKPLLKPDWSPDYFLSYNYISHFTCLRRVLLEEAGLFHSQYDGVQDYDLYLRISERTNRIYHLPRVLYHWRRTTTSTADNIWRKPRALDAGKRAIEKHLERRGEAGDVIIDWRTYAYWVKREIGAEEKISIIIPAHDRIESLARCVDSLTSVTRYQNYEIVIVESQSTSDDAPAYFSTTPHRVLHFPGVPNVSALNNFAVEQTSSPWLLFLNENIEAIDGDWLTAMAEHVQRREVGAVGARLLSSDNTVQHAGMVVGVGDIADYAFRGFPADHPGVNRQLQITRNYTAVTGACLLTRRGVFKEVGGFDAERLPASYSDIDLCLKMRRAGYLIVYTPFARLYQHESIDHASADEARAANVIRERWPEALQRDPYYNRNLSRTRADFSLGK
jgi:glycosyltransferase involved in cell wall biosynthesis